MPIGFKHAQKHHNDKKKLNRKQNRNETNKMVSNEMNGFDYVNKSKDDVFVDRLSRPYASHKKLKTRQKNDEIRTFYYQ